MMNSARSSFSRGWPVADVQINEQQIMRALQSAFMEANQVMQRDFVREFETNKWQWPGQTQRRVGVAGSPRNIVDTSQLLQSYQPFPEPPFAYVHSWTASHALPVALGAVLSNGTTLPARNWTVIPLEKFPQRFETLAAARIRSIP